MSCSQRAAALRSITPDADKLTAADPSDIAAALAFALYFAGRKRIHNADEILPKIVAKEGWPPATAPKPAIRERLIAALPRGKCAGRWDGLLQSC